MTAIRRLAAILAADVAGYSRLMGADEEGALDAHWSDTRRSQSSCRSPLIRANSPSLSAKEVVPRVRWSENRRNSMIGDSFSTPVTDLSLPDAFIIQASNSG
jgi:hypothetical protein